MKLFPAVALLGQGQVGKTALAWEIAKSGDGYYLSLFDRRVRKMLDEKRLRPHIERVKKPFTIIDMAGSREDLFPALVEIVEDRKSRGDGESCLLLIEAGSMRRGRRLKKQMKGQLDCLQLDPLDVSEIDLANEIDTLWLRGGLPEVFNKESNQISLECLQDMLMILADSILPAGCTKRPWQGQMLRLLRSLAASQGQAFNVSSLGKEMGLSKRSVVQCVRLLEDMGIVRMLPPYGQGKAAGLAREPRIYFQDSGTLHSILHVESLSSMSEDLAKRSWQGFAIENILRHAEQPVSAGFYCSKKGVEAELVIHSRRCGPWAIGIRKGAPEAAPGFSRAVKEIKPVRSFLVHSLRRCSRSQSRQGVETLPLLEMCKEVACHFG